MAEQVETTPVEQSDKVARAGLAEEPTSPAEAVVEPTMESTPESKKRGRPKGAADKAPRKKKVVVIEEPVAPPPEPPAPQKAAVVDKDEPPRECGSREAELAMSSPRTLMRESARHILDLKRLQGSTRKFHLGELYSKSLHRL